ncbi:unnamed protein product [marine sediment metagenome]|uniref:Uncharacterized protein n=1 Tax=marine sediment metagenome TaxID=412755 RepID=X1A9F6_9ZZZZ
MKTKEAIKFLNETKIYTDEDEDNFIEVDKLNKTIDLLKRGENFEKMYEEIYNELHNSINEPDNYNWYVDVMEEVKEKYFPKPTIDIDKLCKDLRDFHKKLLKEYFPTEDDKIIEFDSWKKED